MPAQYQRFVIITYPRSGTHMLRTALNGHPNIHCAGELFNPNKADHPYPLTEPVENILAEHAYPELCGEIQATGFVHHAYHPGIQQTWPDNRANPAWEDIWDSLTAIPGLKVIHLYRNNLLQRHLSQVLARNSGHWQTYTDPETAKRDGKPYNPRPDKRPAVNLDVKLLQQDFTETLQHRSRITEVFSGKKILPVTYENLCADFSNQIKRILDFLDLAHQNLKPQLVKLENRRMQDAIGNYAEIKNQLKNSPWIGFFTER